MKEILRTENKWTILHQREISIIGKRSGTKGGRALWQELRWEDEEKQNTGARDTVQQLRTLPVLPEDPNSAHNCL